MVEKTTPTKTTAGKADPREPDTAADRDPSTPAGWQDTDDAARLAGFHTIDGHPLPEGSGAAPAVRMPAQNADNSTFGSRRAARLGGDDKTVAPVDVDTK